MYSMKRLISLFILSAFLTLSITETYAQDSTGMAPVTDTMARVRIGSIRIAGNQKTKDYIILREMRVKTGDSIPAGRIYEILEQSRQLIYNTNLFSEVQVIPVLGDGSNINLFVYLKERWYIWPAPQFKLVDRNLNEWVNRYNANLNRVTYGIKFAHYNFSGRADQLRIYLLNGFSRTVAASYTAPYSNARLTEGFSIFASLSQTREVQYKTSQDNQLLRFNNNDFSRNEYMLRASYQLRRGYYRKHLFTAGFWYHSVADSIRTAKYNPLYLNNGRSTLGFPFFGYTFQYVKVNNINYPLKGITYNASILKRGIGFTGGVNHLRLEGHFNIHEPYGRNWYGAYQFLGVIKAPFRTAYINQRAMGYEEFYLRGLENYVVDGFAAAIAKYTLSKKLISFNIPLPWKFKAIPSIPFTFFAKTYADAGWSGITRELDTKLNNRLLYTGGIGIDMLTLYDICLKIEYSFNQLGEKGLFLHAKTNL